MWILRDRWHREQRTTSKPGPRQLDGPVLEDADVLDDRLARLSSLEFLVLVMDMGFAVGLGLGLPLPASVCSCMSDRGEDMAVCLGWSDGSHLCTSSA